MDWGGGAGRSASLAQYIATWAKRCESPSLKLISSLQNQEYVKKFLSQQFGLSAVYFSDHVSEQNLEENIRTRCLREFPLELKRCGNKILKN